MHEAFFFGPSNQRIFANYHPAAGGGGQVLTVICPPLFADYMRTHHALRELAIALAEKGHHVFRFDYRGTGDSFGELLEVTVADWIEDIALAVQEGCEISGCKHVRLLGVRAGALLACAAARASRNVQRLVLWDPIPDGAGYLELLHGIQIALCERNSHLGCHEREVAMHEYAGYALADSMLEEFRLLDAGVYSGVPKSALHVVSTSSAVGFPVQGVPEHVTPYVCNWDMAADELIVPRPVLERLIACLTLS
jgi:pimeloyl-ACP methyl ester carboxylesterase